MRHLDLFSGIGGFALAARRVGWETVGFCEIDPYCQKVLRKHWPSIPIYDDVRELNGETVGHIDIITGGYPCQPFSVAGKRRGKEDDRHLWPEFARIIRETKPHIVVAENVVGHISMGLDDVLADLENEDYTWWSFIIPACGVNAPHRRERLWVVAYADSKGPQERPINPRMEGETNGRNEGENPSVCGWWDSEPSVGRVVNGLSGRVDRLKGLGNAIVPQVAETIFRSIKAVS